MAWMNHGGFVFPVNPVFDGMAPRTQNNCVPVTVGVGDRVPVTVRVSVRVTQTVQQTVSQPTLQITAQTVQVFVPNSVGVSNPLQQRVQQSQEVSVADLVPTGSTLQEFARNFGAVGVTTLAAAAEKARGVRALAELAKEVAVDNAAVADTFADAAGGLSAFGQRLKNSGVSAEALKQALSKSGMSYFDANNLANAFKQSEKVFVQTLEKMPVKDIDMLMEQIRTAQRQLYQSINRSVSQACAA